MAYDDKEIVDDELSQSEPYTYRIIWSDKEQQYVGLCDEFPSLSYLDKNLEKALAGIRNLVKSASADTKKSGESLGVSKTPTVTS